MANLNIEQIGIMHNVNTWTVTVITKEAIHKLTRGITKNLEVFGLTFVEFKNAMLVQNLLLVHIFKPLDGQYVPEHPDDE